jgi:hypothetical protein
MSFRGVWRECYVCTRAMCCVMEGTQTHMQATFSVPIAATTLLGSLDL